MRKQNPAGGSIVATASVAAYERFLVVDYTASKHGVLGLVRGLSQSVRAAGLPIRVNGLAPGWTITGMVPAHITPVIEATGMEAQGPEAVARSAALLMADSERNGQLIYSDRGKFYEIESVFRKATEEIMEGQDINATMLQMFKMRDQHANGQGAVPGSNS
jgi:NAD(P)-dependent dehydrogenase (short-subunit alcohol dehydrogenase family)